MDNVPDLSDPLFVMGIVNVTNLLGVEVSYSKKLISRLPRLMRNDISRRKLRHSASIYDISLSLLKYLTPVRCGSFSHDKIYGPTANGLTSVGATFLVNTKTCWTGAMGTPSLICL